MTNRLIPQIIFTSLLLMLALLVTAGCDAVPLHMRVQSRYEPLDPSPLWENGSSARPVPANTVPRGHWGQMMLNSEYYTGKITDTVYVDKIPAKVDRAMLLRGQQRFDIFCSPCHGRAGNGQGMIVQRGFKKQPPSFYDQRLVGSPDGYFYNVITNGFGIMYGYGSRIHPADRWAIVAYIRALQYSQNVSLDSLSPAVRQKIEAQLK